MENLILMADVIQAGDRGACECGHAKRMHIKDGACVHWDPCRGRYCSCLRYRVPALSEALPTQGLGRKNAFANVADGMKCR